jgi:hypothetical protein
MYVLIESSQQVIHLKGWIKFLTRIVIAIGNLKVEPSSSHESWLPLGTWKLNQVPHKKRDRH